MSSSNKPQIFINHVDHHISSDAIKSVCEAICGGKSTVTLRPSHDKNYQTCTISLSSQEEEKAERRFWTIRNLQQQRSLAIQLHPHQCCFLKLIRCKLVNVSWKKGEDSESSDRILYVRNLKEDVNDQIVKNTLEKFAKVVSVEIKWVSKGDVQKKNAFVEMSSKDECEKLCIKSHAEAEIKNLFLFQKPQIAAYLPKSEISAFINIQTNSLPIQIQQQIVQQQLHQNQGFPIPDNKQFVHPGQPIYPFFTNPQFIPQDGQFPGVYGVNAFPQQFPYGKKPYRNHPYNAQFGGDQQQQFSQQPQPQHPQHQHPHQYQHRNQHQQQRPHNQQRSNNNNNYNNNRNNRHQNNRPNQFIPMQSQFPLPQQAFQQFQQFPPNPNQIPPQAVFPNVVDQVTSQTNQESALAWCSKTTAEEIKRKISSDKSIYETYVKEAIKELASKEVQTKYPAYISFLEQIVDMLTDPETFQEDDVVDLIYNTTQFQDFVKEGVDLIEDDKNNKSNE